MLLNSYVESKQSMEVLANDNIVILSDERITQYTRDNLIDTVYGVHIQDCMQTRLTPI